MDPRWIPALVFLGIPIVGIPWLIAAARRRSTAVDAFLARLDALGGRPEGRGRVFAVGAREIRADYSPGSRNSPQRFRLTTAVRASSSFELLREDATDRFVEGLGLEGKIATGDPDFDATFRIVSDDDAFAAACFYPAPKRAAARSLFDLGCSRLALERSGLSATWSPFPVRADTRADFVAEALRALDALAADLPEAAPLQPAGGPGRRLAGALFAVSLLAVYAGFAFLPWLLRSRGPLDAGRMAWASLRFSAPVFAAYAALCTAFLARRSWFLRGLLQTVGSAALALPLAAFIGFVWTNSALDPGSPMRHAAPVFRKYWTSGRHSNRYYLVVRSWRPDRRWEKLEVPRRDYDRAAAGRTLGLIDTKPGRLGYEWIVGWTLVDAPPLAPARAIIR